MPHSCFHNYCNSQLHWKQFSHMTAAYKVVLLTLNMKEQSYPGLTRSISWLLMPRLLASPGQQQPWFWWCKLGRSLLTWGRISTTCVMSLWKNNRNCKYMFLFLLKNLAHKELIIRGLFYQEVNPSETKPLEFNSSLAELGLASLL